MTGWQKGQIRRGSPLCWWGGGGCRRNYGGGGVWRLPFFVCREEKTVGLVKHPHFNFEACLEIHRAGETGEVSIAGLVYRGDRVK